MPARNQRRRPRPDKKASPRVNERFPKRDRKQSLRSQTAGWGPRPPVLVPVTWLNTALGLALLPLAVITTMAFFSSFALAAVGQSAWRNAPFWFFCWGLIIWLAAFMFGLRPRYLYVLGHELTHALFVVLSGGRIHEFRVAPEGGHVIADKNNLLISLSPYIVPLWSLVVTALYGLACSVWDLGRTYQGVWFGHGAFRWDWLLFFVLGYTWGLHLTFTAWMITREQPDLRRNGTFFSLVLIYFINLLLISSLLITASPDLRWDEFVGEWVRHLKSATALVSGRL
jgi:hypothetical protein